MLARLAPLAFGGFTAPIRVLFQHYGIKPPTALADLGVPKTPADAPRTITVPSAMQARFVELRQAHLEQAKKTDGYGKERCTTLVRDKSTGALTQINELVGTGKNCVPNLEIDSSRFELVGMFHTHVNLDRKTLTPMDPPDPSPAFSGGDVAWQLQQKVPVSILQGSTTHFMLVRTEATPSVTPSEDAKLRQESKAELDALTGRGGARSSVTNEKATLLLAEKMAKEYKLALYVGQDGTFNRVEPR